MINKFQQGGQTGSLEQAIMLFILGIAEVLKADPLQVVLVAQLNPKALESAVLVYLLTLDILQAAQAFALSMLQQTQAARHGAKLNYIKSLKHQCAEDEELYYFKKGGSVGCGCKKKMEDGGKTPKKKSAVDNFKNRKLDLAPYKKESGGQINKNCGSSKMKIKKSGGEVCPKCGKVHKVGMGCAVAKFKMHRLGGSLTKI